MAAWAAGKSLKSEQTRVTARIIAHRSTDAREYRRTGAPSHFLAACRRSRIPGCETVICFARCKTRDTIREEKGRWRSHGATDRQTDTAVKRRGRGGDGEGQWVTGRARVVARTAASGERTHRDKSEADGGPRIAGGSGLRANPLHFARGPSTKPLLLRWRPSTGAARSIRSRFVVDSTRFERASLFPAVGEPQRRN